MMQTPETPKLPKKPHLFRAPCSWHHGTGRAGLLMSTEKLSTDLFCLTYLH